MTAKRIKKALRRLDAAERGRRFSKVLSLEEVFPKVGLK